MRVFVSYRREDNPWVAGRLRDRLVEAYGDSNVFFDVDDIPMGDDFRDVIRGTLEDVDVVLAIIGSGWNPDRLAEGTDFVRAELVEALRLHKRVIPVLIGDTPMPSVAVLPSDLGEFAYLNAVRLRPDPDFTSDVARLVTGLGERKHTTNGSGDGNRKGLLVVVVLLLLVVGLVVAGVLIAGGSGEGDGSGGGGTGSDGGGGTGGSTSALAMPANADVFQHPVTEVMPVLLGMGLEAISGTDGCSNSTDPGLVSQVTVGRFPDDHIIYGEEGQMSINEELRANLHAGTQVTVWTPIYRPCL